MSGLLALLDDVAALAKVAAASIDDVTAQALKASSKAAGVVIDDAAVTPKYVTGMEPARELPMIWRITKGSIFNKIVILLPLALLLSAFVPWIIMPLLMIGGCYLAYEGAHKVLSWVVPHDAGHDHAKEETSDPAHLEEERVRGAIKTDFILSAEIMVIILNELPAEASVPYKAVALAIAGLAITVAVYGAVALIVKADDVGLRMVERGRTWITRRVGLALVEGMPTFLKVLSTVGTLAMLWVGGAIIVHGLEATGWWTAPYEAIKAASNATGEALRYGQGFARWAAAALMDGVLGLAVGLALIPLLARIVLPTWGTVKRQLGRG